MSVSSTFRKAWSYLCSSSMFQGKRVSLPSGSSTPRPKLIFSCASGWFSVVVAILFALFVYFLERTATLPFGRTSLPCTSLCVVAAPFHRLPRSAAFWARKLVTDYAFAAGIILFTGFVHMCALASRSPAPSLTRALSTVPVKSRAPTSNSWTSPAPSIHLPSQSFVRICIALTELTSLTPVSRNWVVPFWELPVRWVFASLPFGLLITLLFYFDVRSNLDSPCAA